MLITLLRAAHYPQETYIIIRFHIIFNVIVTGVLGTLGESFLLALQNYTHLLTHFN